MPCSHHLNVMQSTPRHGPLAASYELSGFSCGPAAASLPLSPAAQARGSRAELPAKAPGTAKAAGFGVSGARSRAAAQNLAPAALGAAGQGSAEPAPPPAGLRAPFPELGGGRNPGDSEPRAVPGGSGRGHKCHRSPSPSPSPSRPPSLAISACPAGERALPVCVLL